MLHSEAFICADCNIDINAIHELCYITDELWLKACSKQPEIDTRRVLCIGCIENRIGRRLASKDFVRCELNGHDFGRPKSDRLLNRLQTKIARLKLHS